MTILEANQVASAKVLSVNGNAHVQAKDAEKKPLAEGEILVEGDSVITKPGGKVHLVFSNGSELNLKENTKLKLKQLSQEPFISDKEYEQLQADPSKSTWLLQLKYGELSGHVKQLRSDSEFSIKTDFGTAVVYGTNFSMAYIYDFVSNQFNVSIKNDDGLVDFVSRFAKSVDFGSGSSASIAYSSDAEEAKKFVPPGYVINISQSGLDPEYSSLVNSFASIPGVPQKKVTSRSGGLDDLSDPQSFVPIDQPSVIETSPNTPSN